MQKIPVKARQAADLHAHDGRPNADGTSDGLAHPMASRKMKNGTGQRMSWEKRWRTPPRRSRVRTREQHRQHTTRNREGDQSGDQASLWIT
jgi:hypothetical protein